MLRSITSSAINGLHICSIIGQRSHISPYNITSYWGQPPQSDGMVLLMKTPVTYVMEHGDLAFVNLETSLLDSQWQGLQELQFHDDFYDIYICLLKTK